MTLSFTHTCLVGNKDMVTTVHTSHTPFLYASPQRVGVLRGRETNEKNNNKTTQNTTR